ncbi:CCAAT/enhancer-binding protein alpha-like [Battus philenor]|uniref:CCAAT/enhancer-binding protein alpha-like n=1 Tax=Battus philenor TaxID=42288 RepID=UPI0035CF585F
MSLWTPYADEALDLSRTAVKRERASPEPEPLEYSPVRFYPHPSSPPDSLSIPHPCYVGYHEAPCVPSAQISPESAGSGWSPRSSHKSLSPSRSLDAYEAESLSEDVEYLAFERDALRAMAEKNGGTLLGNNPRMRRAVQTNQAADDSYRKQRERNNYAAKQSRDRRKLREVRLAFQVTFLKKKLADLRARLENGICARC